MTTEKSIYKNASSTTHALLILSALLMIGFSIYLTNHYFEVHFPQGLSGSSLCEINSFLSCGAATYSALSNVAGIPISVFGVLIGFSGIVFLFSDNILINENNFLSALIIFFASTFYVIGGLLTLKISNKKNENVTASILIWATLFLIPITAYTEQPWNLNPSLESTISVIYLGIVATGFAWLLRFKILINNGLVFQAQVAYLIPIFGIILGYIFLNELITPKVVVAVAAVIIGIYFVKKSNNKTITSV